MPLVIFSRFGNFHENGEQNTKNSCTVKSKYPVFFGGVLKNKIKKAVKAKTLW